MSVYCLNVVALQPTAWVSRLLALLYPDVCQICRERHATRCEGYVCRSCWIGVRFIRPPLCERCGLPFEGEMSNPFECANCRDLDLHFDQARSGVFARGLVREVIHRYKYRQALWFEPFLADLLTRQAAPALSAKEWDVILPVPLHPVRERERQFNQARRLAGHLSRATGLPVNTQCLRRIRATDPQATLSRAARMDNVQRAFTLRPDAHVDGMACVIVDDVFTTGATTSACARTLKGGGARKVCVWTVARGV